MLINQHDTTRDGIKAVFNASNG
ncbi:hypothetical protein MED222_13215 [Vibrio sp. MED222]|nr:hypothetical protein MED222_13215 [Vibrio sp. MED222]